MVENAEEDAFLPNFKIVFITNSLTMPGYSGTVARSCRTCGGQGHLAAKCRTCLVCFKWGHHPDDCRSDPNAANAYCRLCKDEDGFNGRRHWTQHCEKLHERKSYAREQAQHSRLFETWKGETDADGNNVVLDELCKEKPDFDAWMTANIKCVRCVEETPKSDSESDSESDGGDIFECEKCGTHFNDEEEAEAHEEQCFPCRASRLGLKKLLFKSVIRALARTRQKKRKQALKVLKGAWCTIRVKAMLRPVLEDLAAQELIKNAFKRVESTQSTDLRQYLEAQTAELKSAKPRAAFCAPTKAPQRTGRKSKKAQKRDKKAQEGEDDAPKGLRYLDPSKLW